MGYGDTFANCEHILPEVSILCFDPLPMLPVFQYICENCKIDRKIYENKGIYFSQNFKNISCFPSLYP